MIPSKRVRHVTMGSTTLDSRAAARPQVNTTHSSRADARARLQRPLARGDAAAARISSHRAGRQLPVTVAKSSSVAARAAKPASGATRAVSGVGSHFQEPTDSSRHRSGGARAGDGSSHVAGAGDRGTLHLAATAAGNSTARALDPTFFGSMAMVNRLDEATANDTAVGTRGGSLAGRRDAGAMPAHTGTGFRPSSGPSLGHGTAAKLVAHRMPVPAAARSPRSGSGLQGDAASTTGRAGMRFQGSMFRPHRPRDTAPRNRPTGMGAMPGAVALVSSERSLPTQESLSGRPAALTGAELDATDQWESDSDDTHCVSGAKPRNGSQQSEFGGQTGTFSKRVGFAAVGENPPATPIRSVSQQRLANQASLRAPSITEDDLQALNQSARHRHRPSPRPPLDAFKLAESARQREASSVAPKVVSAIAPKVSTAVSTDHPPQITIPSGKDHHSTARVQTTTTTTTTSHRGVSSSIRQIRSCLSDAAFGQLCAELESVDRQRSGVVGWQEFARVLSRLTPDTPLRTRRDVARLVAATGSVLRPGRQVDYVQFFDRVVPTRAEAEAVATGTRDLGEVVESGVAVQRATRAEIALKTLDRMTSIEAYAKQSGDTAQSISTVTKQPGVAEHGFETETHTEAAGGGPRRSKDTKQSVLSQPRSPSKLSLPGESELVSLRDLTDVARLAAQATVTGGHGEEVLLVDGSAVSGSADVVTGSQQATSAGKRTTALRMREEAIRSRLKLVSDRPTKVTAADVVRLMRDRAVRSSTLSAFRSIDIDNNGVLDVHELRHALRRLRLDLPISEAEALVEAIDVNGDGVLQWDEWTAFAADRQREEAAANAVWQAPEAKSGSGRLSPVTAAHHSARANALARIEQARTEATSSSLTVARHNPPPATARTTGNRRGVVRAPGAAQRLQVIAQSHPEVVAAFPLKLSDCAALVRRLDAEATSFVAVEDLHRHLLREASRLTKAGVSSLVDAHATRGAVVQATALPETDEAGVREARPDKIPLDSFPVSDAVREAARDVALLCDTNGDGWVQADDVAEVGRVLARRTVAGRSNPPLGYEDHVSGAADVVIGYQGVGVASTGHCAGAAETKEESGGMSAHELAARLAAVGTRPPGIDGGESVQGGVPVSASQASQGADRGLEAGNHALSAFDATGPSLARRRLEQVHPSVRDAAFRIATRHAALSGTAAVAMTWLVSDSDSDSDGGGGGGGAQAFNSHNRGDTTGSAVKVPGLPMDVLAASRARDASRVVPLSSTERSRSERRNQAFSHQAHSGSATARATARASTSGGHPPMSARPLQSWRIDGPGDGDESAGHWATLAGINGTRHGVARGGEAAGVAGTSAHGFASKARRAARQSGRATTTRAAMARAKRSPRFDPSDPVAFEALSARGARLQPPTRLGGKAAELAEPSDRVVKPRSDMLTSMSPRADGDGGMETEAQATMREGLTVDRGAQRLYSAEMGVAIKRTRKERAEGHVLESYRRQAVNAERLWDARLAKVRQLQAAQKATEDARNQHEVQRRLRQGKRMVAQPLIQPAFTLG